MLARNRTRSRFRHFRRTVAPAPPTTFNVKDSAGNTYVVPLTVLSSTGASYAITTTVLSSNGTPYVV